MARALTWTVAVVVVLYVAVVALAWMFQRKLTYFPDSDAPPPAAEIIPGAQDVTLWTSDGLQLGAWLVPPTGPPSGLTVLVCNGNGGDRAGRAELASALSEAGSQVLLFDYRGYAGNQGSPSEEGLARDALAAYDYLTAQAGVPPERLLVFGESLGAAVATRLAVEHPVGGVLLRSPFTELAAVGQDHYPFLPVGLLLKEEFPVASLVDEVAAPLVVVYGSADATVSPSQSRTVAEAATSRIATVEVDGADHNDAALAFGPEVVAAVHLLEQELRD